MCTQQIEEMGRKEIYHPAILSGGGVGYIASIVAAISSNASRTQRFSEYETKFHVSFRDGNETKHHRALQYSMENPVSVMITLTGLIRQHK